MCVVTRGIDKIADIGIRENSLGSEKSRQGLAGQCERRVVNVVALKDPRLPIMHSDVIFPSQVVVVAIRENGLNSDLIIIRNIAMCAYNNVVCER